MTRTLVKKLIVAMVLLQTMYAAIVVLLYRDLIEPIRYPLIRTLTSASIILGGYWIYLIVADPIQVRNLIPVETAAIKNSITAHITPFVARSIYTMGIISALTSAIDKMLYILWKTRLPYPLSIGATAGVGYVAGFAMYSIIHENPASLADKIYALEEIEQWVMPPLYAIAIFLFTAISMRLLIHRTKTNKKKQLRHPEGDKKNDARHHAHDSK